MAWKHISATKELLWRSDWVITGANIDHGALLGLGDNDHPQYLLVTDIDDTPVNGETAQPISSNWAFDHVAAADPHTGYILESLIDAAGDLIVGTADNTVGRLAKGVDDQVLTMVAGSVAWAAASGGSDKTPMTPQGRLTLTTGTPVMTAEAVAQTTIYYTPYVGDVIPLYDGSSWTNTTFAEISIAMAASANWAANSNYDLYVYNDGGTIRLVTGAAWTSDTARNESLTRLNGIWTNAASMTGRYAASSTVTVAANRGTYVGTVRTTASTGTTTWELGGAASGGDPVKLYLWNCYNRVVVTAASRDTTDSWTTTTNAFASLNASTANRATFVRGLNEDAYYAGLFVPASIGTNANAGTGVGLDSTSANSAQSLNNGTFSSTFLVPWHSQYDALPGLGLHYLQALQHGGSSGFTVTYYGDAGLSFLQEALLFRGMF